MVPKCTCGHRIEGPIATEQDVLCIGNSCPPFCAASNVKGSTSVFCKSCSTNILAANITRYNAATETKRIDRSEFERRLLNTRLATSNTGDAELTLSNTCALSDPSHIHNQVHQLRQRLDRLRSISNELAIRVTSKTMENGDRQSEHESYYAKIDLARERLDSMRQNLLVNTEQPQTSEEKKNANSTINVAAGGGGGLRDALVSGTKQIQSTRFHFALRAFEMHRIEVGEEYTNEATNRNGTHASGVGKIGGLPLPHAGPALYGVLPQGMLASSLRLVASLTNLLASCLGVVLPHPILVCSKECGRCGKVYNYGGDVINTLNDVDADDEMVNKNNLCSSCERDDFKIANEYRELYKEQNDQVNHESHRSSLFQRIPSKSSVLSFVGSSARKAVALATGSAATPAPISATTKSISKSTPVNIQQQQNPKLSIPSTADVSRRVSYASFAVLLENHEIGAAEYILNPPRWKEDKQTANNEAHASSREDFHAAEEKFATGLQLLQNDVIALCLLAGVDASTLWPAESLLLNLHSLLYHCVNVVDDIKC